MRKENEKSTPVETPKDERRNHVNMSTEEKSHSNMGLIAIVVLVLIVVLGFLFFSGLW